MFYDIFKNLMFHIPWSKRFVGSAFGGDSKRWIKCFPRKRTDALRAQFSDFAKKNYPLSACPRGTANFIPLARENFALCAYLPPKKFDRSWERADREKCLTFTCSWKTPCELANRMLRPKEIPLTSQIRNVRENPFLCRTLVLKKCKIYKRNGAPCTVNY